VGLVARLVRGVVARTVTGFRHHFGAIDRFGVANGLVTGAITRVTLTIVHNPATRLHNRVALLFRAAVARWLTATAVRVICGATTGSHRRAGAHGGYNNAYPSGWLRFNDVCHTAEASRVKQTATAKFMKLPRFYCHESITQPPNKVAYDNGAANRRRLFYLKSVKLIRK